jgi:hypothetical protein
MFMHVRQHLPVRGKAGAATARKLIAASQGPSRITLAATEECAAYADHITVVPCRSKQLQVKCGVTLVPDQLYYMVRSPKFVNRWYVLTRNVSSRAWVCSLCDMQDRCVAQVEAFLLARAA